VNLELCLTALCAQTNKNFEVLVCDDGSLDDTLGLVTAFTHRLALKYFW
jgi:glycosyltransferase involved in cell wall biosynthesis